MIVVFGARICRSIASVLGLVSRTLTSNSAMLVLSYLISDLGEMPLGPVLRAILVLGLSLKSVCNVLKSLPRRSIGSKDGALLLTKTDVSGGFM